MRIVIDSNVWISAIVFGGNPRSLFEKVIANGWTIVVSEEILTEIRRIIAKKFDSFVGDFDQFYALLRPRIIVVPLGTLRIKASRDEDDNRVIETAVIGQATYIISGDKDLLVLGKYRQIIILTPTTFLDSVT
jgi:putative PIN family toxin of toxin-antitoxin system